MLSPFRSGSGLFCTLQSAPPLTPKSAPEWGKISLSRRGSSASVKQEGLDEPLIAVAAEAEQAPETDTEAHINIGPEYQAVLPQIRDIRNARFER